MRMSIIQRDSFCSLIRVVKVALSMMMGLFLLSGCGSFGLYDADSSAVVATVGDVELRESSLKDIYFSAATPEDSLALKEAFVNAWVLEEVRHQAAQREIEGDERSWAMIESMVEQYRSNLLSYTFEQRYLAEHIDTTVTTKQIQKYYKDNSASFRLAGPLVKAIAVRIPAGLRQSRRLEAMFTKGDEEALDDFINICNKNNYPVYDYRDSWVDFRTVLQHIPFTRKNFDDFLRSRKHYDVTDDRYKYMMRIETFLPSGAVSPIERESGTITRILRNQRRGALINELNDSLLNSATTLGVIGVVDMEK